MPKIDESEVRRIAHLSRLNPTDDEVRLFADQLSAVLEYMEQLNEVDTTDVPPTAHALPVRNVFRDDEPGGCLTPDEALAAAPARDGSFFAVPKVLEQDSV
ncbi:MAG TPA: Asp-tRNA(Asn)/Glu-tRNA(Gln) amidotransferase subunit GatC [Phycisphaerae bacterium]|nr:Asp-tRNA(Asn)/Glu-tRNA(Gln) amidotransferase subunit GatC [Phycisphaerae bacterium]HOJ75471.1 Asp-tRNA(Asn)/Glu-tRNA(Gln) amidotransferase subunit GatC [Phycisphaerae bacterium]HOM52271.1 Asp-tRNA(Asn)/Glu-tRNA(Gln) amidotransferase subunit GatC [Phycisphaerae bacterium]HON66277.1 Asp-tRNA(Asn)/Glu-tRNA(Gln) amidotransferase subunit GatC [Phycisphaerae bacterium]HOQ86925.1 Asp-tRNA(Asn)/Glu-tRNA(Gln) amidotransferase subunit GatC [Phycisphaerae bacterium]